MPVSCTHALCSLLWQPSLRCFPVAGQGTACCHSAAALGEKAGITSVTAQR